MLLAVLLLMSKGAAGVTGSGFIVLAATLSAVGKVPVGGLALILGIDRFMSEARALTNVIGNGVASIVVARWTGDLDTATLDRQLAIGPPTLSVQPSRKSRLPPKSLRRSAGSSRFRSWSRYSLGTSSSGTCRVVLPRVRVWRIFNALHHFRLVKLPLLEQCSNSSSSNPAYPQTVRPNPVLCPSACAESDRMCESLYRLTSSLRMMHVNGR